MSCRSNTAPSIPPCIASFWGTSENNRKAKYYCLTPAGRKQLIAQTTRWEQLVEAIGRILKPATE